MAEQPAQAPRPDLLETIVFRVSFGQDQQDYTVHKSFAIKSSLTIKGFLNYREEAQVDLNEPVPMTKTKPADFEVYIHWLYTGKIVTTDTKGTNSYGTTLVRLYILGKKHLDDEAFADTIFKIISSLLGDKSMVFESAAVRLVWRNLTSKDVLRARLLRAMLVSSLGKPDCAKFLSQHDWPRGVDAGSMMAALERRQYSEFFKGADSSEVGKALTALLGPAKEEV